MPFNSINSESLAMMGRYLVTGITFGVFMAEALIHYNMGRAKEDRKMGREPHFELPPPKELAKIAAVTGVFSVASGVLIESLNKYLPPKA
jgi:hypothetical protein